MSCARGAVWQASATWPIFAAIKILELPFEFEDLPDLGLMLEHPVFKVRCCERTENLTI